ncbi:hypothetical protein OPV22_021508 [Ensete ventricosum]|uniref:Uncharacterized protein n=1 Tax=Ensete ventricosum TaxID=4639 RepID=A0AAV8PD13_ENSVE|nr:hypothetical protein OPV22_021508 [Ensete ventricosum]
MNFVPPKNTHGIRLVGGFSGCFTFYMIEEELGFQASDDEVTNRFICGQIDSTETFASLWSVFDLGLFDLIVSLLPLRNANGVDGRVSTRQQLRPCLPGELR